MYLALLRLGHISRRRFDAKSFVIGGEKYHVECFRIRKEFIQDVIVEGEALGSLAGFDRNFEATRQRRRKQNQTQ